MYRKKTKTKSWKLIGAVILIASLVISGLIYYSKNGGLESLKGAYRTVKPGKIPTSVSPSDYSNKVKFTLTGNVFSEQKGKEGKQVEGARVYCKFTDFGSVTYTSKSTTQPAGKPFELIFDSVPKGRPVRLECDFMSDDHEDGRYTSGDEFKAGLWQDTNDYISDLVSPKGIKIALYGKVVDTSDKNNPIADAKVDCEGNFSYQKQLSVLPSLKTDSRGIFRIENIMQDNPPSSYQKTVSCTVTKAGYTAYRLLNIAVKVDHNQEDNKQNFVGQFNLAQTGEHPDYGTFTVQGKVASAQEYSNDVVKDSRVRCSLSSVKSSPSFSFNDEAVADSQGKFKINFDKVPRNQSFYFACDAEGDGYEMGSSEKYQYILKSSLDSSLSVVKDFQVKLSPKTILIALNGKIMEKNTEILIPNSIVTCPKASVLGDEKGNFHVPYYAVPNQSGSAELKCKFKNNAYSYVAEDITFTVDNIVKNQVDVKKMQIAKPIYMRLDFINIKMVAKVKSISQSGSPYLDGANLVCYSTYKHPILGNAAVTPGIFKQSAYSPASYDFPALRNREYNYGCTLISAVNHISKTIQDKLHSKMSADHGIDLGEIVLTYKVIEKIEGTVRRADFNKAISNAKVVCPNLEPAITDANGNFKIEFETAKAEGYYSGLCEVTHEGFESQKKSVTIDTKDDSLSTKVDFVLAPKKFIYNYNGTVVSDFTGNVIANAIVSCSDNDSKEKFEIHTDNFGKYELKIPMTYDVDKKYDCRVSKDYFLPRTVQLAVPAVKNDTKSSSSQHVLTPMKRVINLTVNAKYPNGNNVNGALVFCKNSSTNSNSVDGKTNEYGNVTFSNLSAYAEQKFECSAVYSGYAKTYGVYVLEGANSNPVLKIVLNP